MASRFHSIKFIRGVEEYNLSDNIHAYQIWDHGLGSEVMNKPSTILLNNALKKSRETKSPQTLIFMRYPAPSSYDCHNVELKIEIKTGYFRKSDVIKFTWTDLLTKEKYIKTWPDDINPNGDIRPDDDDFWKQYYGLPLNFLEEGDSFIIKTKLSESNERTFTSSQKNSSGLFLTSNVSTSIAFLGYYVKKENLNICLNPYGITSSATSLAEFANALDIPNRNAYNFGGLWKVKNFDARHSWSDWHLVPTSRPVINPPSLKEIYVDVPGANGAIDLSEVVSKRPVYSNRKGSFEFLVQNGFKEWYDMYSEIMDYLHGREMNIVLMDDPDYFYEGRTTVNVWKSEKLYSKITIDCNVFPYKKLLSDPGNQEGWRL